MCIRDSTLTDQEKKYSAYELECLAIVLAFEKFKPFLEHKEFLLETDNQALSWLLNHPKQLGRCLLYTSRCV